MGGPGTNAAAGASAALIGTVLLEALGPNAIPTLIFGAFGGASRWFASQLAVDDFNWKKGLLAIPLGAIFALGVASVAAPFISHWIIGKEADDWMRAVLSTPESRNGIAYLLGAFASQILSMIDRRTGASKNG